MLVALVVVAVLAAVGVVLLHDGLTGGATTQNSPNASGVNHPAGSGPGGAAVPTVSSVVSFSSGRVLTASQHVAFNEPVHSVTVAVPQQATQVAGGMFDPRIGNLQVLVAGHAPINVSVPLRPGADVTIPLPSPQTELDLAYVAYGAVHTSVPSSSHRAAALVTTLSVAPATGLSTIKIEGSNVTNIGCFAADGTAQACGTQVAGGWTVMRGSGDPGMAIIAQLDLGS